MPKLEHMSKDFLIVCNDQNIAQNIQNELHSLIGEQFKKRFSNILLRPQTSVFAPRLYDFPTRKLMWDSSIENNDFAGLIICDASDVPTEKEESLYLILIAEKFAKSNKESIVNFHYDTANMELEHLRLILTQNPNLNVFPILTEDEIARSMVELIVPNSIPLSLQKVAT